MRRILFFISMLFITTFVNSQTILFTESFDPPSNADSVTASGASNNFAINTRLFYTGTQCDSSLVTPFDTAFLTTNSFSTIGLPFVFLSFSHICKIELIDGGEVEVSVNNGPWIKLTGSEYVNPGNSQFVSSGNKFNSNTYPLEWFPLQNTMKPTQSWWRNEAFNISALVGNQADVRVRFALRDGNGNGANFAAGWFIDNIAIKGAISELTPPSVHLKTPVFQDTVYTTGYFDIYAYIQDASGIDSTYMIYKLNNGPDVYVPVTWVSDSLYVATIPSFTYTNNICYTVYAVDGSASHNLGSSPFKCFNIKKPNLSVVVGNGTTTSSNLPTNGAYNYSWGSMIYKVSELGFHGIIDSIEFYVNNNITNYQMLNQWIYLGHTGMTSFGTTQPDTTFMTRVYKGSLTFTGPGWYRIKLMTPFNYNGLNNLAIYWMNKDGSYASGYPLFRYTATASNNCAYNASNTLSAVFPVSSGTQTLNRPNFRVSYQGVPYLRDAGIKTITQPTGTILGSIPTPIKVVIKNFGSDTLKKVTVKWSLDNVYQDSINWVGSLPEAVSSLPFAIDTTTFSTGNHTIKAWTVKPNGLSDQYASNDFADTTFYSCSQILNGTYTIGPGGNFPTIAAALDVMTNCGILGPVVFNIIAGTYTGQITIPPISGVSPTNTITFQSATGVNTSVVLQYAAAAAADNWVLRLNGANYIQFKNLTIKSTSTTAYARVIELINGAGNNMFEGNIIQSIVSTSTTAAGIYSYTTAGNNFNVFMNNKILNGYFGVYYYGNSANRKQGTKFIGNEITGWYYYGMYLYYNDSIRIEKNLIQNGSNSTNNYHIYSYYNGFGCTIIKNRIQSTGTTGTFYGIAILSPSANSTTPNVIANNFISQGTGTGAGNGIYLSNASYTNVYYNSVNITGTSTTGRALYSTSGNAEINIVNNILSNTGGGHAMYISTPAPINDCDYNDLYATGTYLGYWSGNRTNLAAWQSASGKDAHSVSGDPQFTSLTDLHTYSQLILYHGTPLASVTDDIDDQPRDITLPSIGADETYRFDYDVSIDSVISPNSSCQLTSSENVTIKITNLGMFPLSNIDVYYTINNGAPVHAVIPGPIDTLVSVYFTFPATINLSAPGNYLFDFRISQSTDQNAINDSINDYWVNGSFNLNAANYTQSFEPNENFTDWAVINTDASSYQWIVPYVSTTYARTGTNSAQFFNNASNLGEDWLFSRCFNLEAGKTYSLSFWYRGNNTTAQTLTVKYGLGQSITAMTNTLATLPGINTTSYQQSISQFVAPTTGSYNFGWNVPSGIGNYLFIDDINFKVVPEQEAALDKISSPSTGCLLTTTEPVKIRIKNTGADTIAGNLTAYYKLNSGSTFSSPVADTIIPGDTLLFTVPTTVNVAATTVDVTHNITAWITLLNDPISSNDLLTKQFVSRHSPALPTIYGATVGYGQTATLQAVSPDIILWYPDNTTPTSMHTGPSYTTPVLFNSTTYYVAATNDIPGYTKQVGTGTATINQVPTYGYYDYGWSSCLYLASDLNFTGTIDTIAYYNNNPTFTMTNQRIYMRHYSGNTLPDVNNPNYSVMTKVFQGNITWTNGWNKIPLTVPFAYNGTSNLDVSWENLDGSWVSGYPIFRGTTVPANRVKYDYQDNSFPTGAGTWTTTRPNTQFIVGGLLGCPTSRIPITATVVPPIYDLHVKEIVSPATGCTFGTEALKIKIINHGIQDIGQPFTAGYYLNGNPVPVMDVVTSNISAGDSIVFTFTNPVNTPVPSGNIPFSFKTFVNITSDPYRPNDTLSKTVTLSYSPPDPVCIGDTVPYGTSATLTATATAPINWFSSATGGSILHTGTSYNTPTLYGNTTFYAEANTTIPGFISQAGTGAATSSFVPTYGLYDYSWSSCLYLNTDLNFLGRIDTIMLYTSNSMTSFQMLDQRIYMRHTTGYTLPNVNNPDVVNMTQVFQGAINFTGPGWVKIALTNPFYYNGANNLEIAWENRDGANTSGYPVFQVSTVPSNMVKYGYQDGSFPTGAGTWITTRPNIKFYHIGFGCPSHRIPVNAVVTNLPVVDAGLLSFTSPSSPISLGNQDINVVLINYGSDTLQSVQINLTINGVLQLPPLTWTGNLPTNGTDTVNLTNYDFTFVPYPGLNYLMAWTQNPNGTIDSTPVNDTITKIVDAHDPMNGVYYIRTNTPDFNSFTEALTAVQAWGIDGPVTFIADTGTYNEHISIPQISGASSINTVTFQSITGVSSDVRIKYAASGSADNYVVQLNGADYIRFRNISIEATSTANYGRVVELKNGSNYNIFEGNRLIGLQVTTNNSTTVHCTDISSSGNTFIGNEMLNAYQSVYIYGSSTNKIKGFKFLNNTISNYYCYGIYTYYCDSVRAIGNKISTNSVAATNYSIYAYYCDNNSRFEKNNISYSGTGTYYGIYLAYNNVTSTLSNWVANNFISNTGCSGTAYGIYCSYSNYINVYYNSVNILAGTTAGTRALYQTSGTNNLNIKNNNLANQVGGYAFYMNTPGAVNVSDYNNLYTSGSVLAFWNSDLNNLAALQAASGKDVHSKSVVPGYLSSTDLHTYQFALIGSAVPVPEITTDIDNDTRNAIHPCIGADELSPSPVDVGVSIINLPINPATSGIQPINLTIVNYGSTTITNLTINYSVNGVLAGTYNWTGTMLSFDTVNVTPGNINLTAGNSLICAWTSMPNGLMDNNMVNDTACTSVIVCGGAISGTYTIGGTNPDFYSFNDALTAMNSCGIAGPVIFNVVTGTYNERLNIEMIAGMSAVNTITFQSATGNNTDVILQNPGSSAVDNYVIQLDGASYFRFKNMTIRSTTTSNFGRVVTLLNNSDHNIFEGNKIHSIVSTSTNASAIYSLGGNMDYNKFNNNEIKGGYYGIYFTSTSSALNKTNEFTNNTISDWYYYGMYLTYSDSVIVDGNTTRNSSGTTTGYHIYSSYADNGCRYENNKIYGDNTGNFYGLYIYYNDGTATEPNIVANNMVSEINGTGTAYGIYLSYSNYINLYYNTVNINGGSATGGRSLYTIGGGNNNLINNNLVASGPGYAYYVGTASGIGLSDYNNIYTTTAQYAYWNGAISNLAALQTASSMNAHSVSGDPIFVSTTDLHATAVSVDGLGQPLLGFTVDIDGDLRSPTTPDIGADEFSALPYDVAVVGFIEPSGISASVGTSFQVIITIRNFGSAAVTSFPVSYQYGSGNPVTVTWTGNLMPNTTTNYTFTTPFITAMGTQSLCAYTAMANDQNISNDNFCKSFSGIPTFVVPYSNNFEGSNYCFTGGTNNSWEFGVPAATTINSAHSPTHAWATNLDGTYNANEFSFLYTPFFNFSMVTGSTLDFWHFYHTETNNDGGRVKYSTNGGNTWITLGIYPNDPNGTNWYNSNLGGSPAWTGNSGGWVHSTYNLASIPSIINATSVQFRFEFTSNGTNNNYDGWAVDDYALTAPPIMKDAGVTAIVSPSGAIQTGTPVTVEVTIKNFGTDTLQAIPVRYTVNGGAVVSGNWTGLLNPGDVTNYTFASTFNAPGNAYDLCAFTKKTGDVYWSNDTTCANFPVTPANVDVGVLNFVHPVDTTHVGQQDSVVITIKNFGLTTVTSIPLSYKVNGVQQAAVVWTGNLLGGNTLVYKFATKYTVPLASYSLCAKTSLPGDADGANDELCMSPLGYNIGIDAYDFSQWDLFQNIPNPANNVVKIGFEIPSPGKVRIEMIDLLGNRILAQENEYPSGRNSFEIDVRSLKAGIYFYSATYNSMVKTKRMIITK